MQTVNFFQVVVLELISEGEKEKWKACPFLIEAYTTFEAESVITNHYKGLTFEWKIKSISESKIREVILRPSTK